MFRKRVYSKNLNCGVKRKKQEERVPTRTYVEEEATGRKLPKPNNEINDAMELSPEEQQRQQVNESEDRAEGVSPTAGTLSPSLIQQGTAESVSQNSAPRPIEISAAMPNRQGSVQVTFTVRPAMSANSTANAENGTNIERQQRAPFVFAAAPASAPFDGSASRFPSFVATSIQPQQEQMNGATLQQGQQPQQQQQQQVRPLSPTRSVLRHYFVRRWPTTILASNSTRSSSPSSTAPMSTAPFFTLPGMDPGSTAARPQIRLPQLEPQPVPLSHLNQTARAHTGDSVGSAGGMTVNDTTKEMQQELQEFVCSICLGKC